MEERDQPGCRGRPLRKRGKAEVEEEDSTMTRKMRWMRRRVGRPRRMRKR